MNIDHLMMLKECLQLPSIKNGTYITKESPKRGPTFSIFENHVTGFFKCGNKDCYQCYGDYGGQDSKA